MGCDLFREKCKGSSKGLWWKKLLKSLLQIGFGMEVVR
jgi:hypothetical protein